MNDRVVVASQELAVKRNKVSSLVGGIWHASEIWRALSEKACQT